MHQIQNRQTPQQISIQCRDDGSPSTISGYAAVYYDPANPGTEYRQSATVTERLERTAFDNVATQNSDVVATFNHLRDTYVLASRNHGSLRLTTDKIGLRYEFDIDHNDPDHARVWPKIQRGLVSGSSFAFAQPKVRRHKEGKLVVNKISDIGTLIDVGPVFGPAYTGTSANVRSADMDAISRRLRVLDLDDSIFGS